MKEAVLGPPAIFAPHQIRMDIRLQNSPAMSFAQPSKNPKNFGIHRNTASAIAMLALVFAARSAAAKSSGFPPWQESFTGLVESGAALETLNTDRLATTAQR